MVKDESNRDEIVRIPVDAIAVNPRQPRKRFDDDTIKSLSDSIRSDGVLQPIVVRPKGDRYELIMGERRVQAARLAGLPTVPAMVRSADEADSLRLALVENLQREDLNPIEVAQAYKTLVDRFDMSQDEVARLVGRDRSSVANSIRLLGLPEEVRTLLIENKLSEGHARALLSLSTRAAQIALAQRISKDKLSVRQVEVEAGAARTKRQRRGKKEKAPHIAYLEKAFAQHLATKVSIEEQRGGKGRIVIEFYSHEEFERLADTMQIPIPR